MEKRGKLNGYKDLLTSHKQDTEQKLFLPLAEKGHTTKEGL